MNRLQDSFPPGIDDRLLAGLTEADDAAAYRLGEQALLFTADFFPPVVDDPWTYGAVAAANALGDIYAMGGQPLLALNLLALPDDLPPDTVASILEGGVAKLREAGCLLVGGHTIDDKEPKYGLAVVGLAHPDRLLTKATARPGDILYLTKPLGTGLLTTMARIMPPGAVDLTAAAANMLRLNRSGAELAEAGLCRAATDVTGFGILGHASEIAAASRVALRFQAEAIPFLPGAMAVAEEWAFPGGSHTNAADFDAVVSFEGALTREHQLALFSPETSGGLLLAIDPAAAPAVEALLQRAGDECYRIGRVEEGRGVIVVGGA